MQPDFDAVIQAPFGHVGLRAGVVKGQEEQGEVLREVVYLLPSIPLKKPNSHFLKHVAQQIEAYFQDPKAKINVPYATVGTAFQNRVWQAISAIPTGQARTYGAIAQDLRSGPRAVGGACGANYYPLLIPCHRVLAAHGLGGFANQSTGGFHLEVKKWLLRHEGIELPQ